jgi:hypothetical protein
MKAQAFAFFNAMLNGPVGGPKGLEDAR